MQQDIAALLVHFNISLCRGWIFLLQSTKCANIYMHQLPYIGQP
jgi:hypothetical protein